jgi:hypothetical protein
MYCFPARPTASVIIEVQTIVHTVLNNKQVSNHMSSSCFFDRLPPEIVQDIFALCIQRSGTRLLPVPPTTVPAEDNSNININDNDNIQLTISHVCSRWRSITLSLPCLWNCFSIRFGLDDDDSRHESTHQLTEMWLSRSKGTLITMDVEVDDFVRSPPKLFTKIRSLISRYKFKGLGRKSELIFPTFQDESYKISLSCVQSLKLTHILNRVVHIQHDLPCLLSLDLNFRPETIQTNHPFPWGVVLPMIPWHQLQRFKLNGGLCVEAAIDILRICSSLVELDLSFDPWTQRRQREVSVLAVLPNLRELKFDSISLITDISTFMYVISAPRLTRLVLKWSDPHPSSVSRIDQLMARLGTQFQQLHEFVVCYPYKGLDIRPILECMPSLRQLTLDAKIRLNQGTANKISNGELGRCLQTISIPQCLDLELLLDTIEKRQELAMGSGSGSI